MLKATECPMSTMHINNKIFLNKNQEIEKGESEGEGGKRGGGVRERE